MHFTLWASAKNANQGTHSHPLCTYLNCCNIYDHPSTRAEKQNHKLTDRRPHPLTMEKSATAMAHGCSSGFFASSPIKRNHVVVVVVPITAAAA